MEVIYEAVSNLWSSPAQLVFTIIAIEAIVEIITSSFIFQRIREVFEGFGPMLAYWINCGYCMSVTVAFIALFLPFWLVLIFALHRLSNVAHGLIWRATNTGSPVLQFDEDDEENDG